MQHAYLSKEENKNFKKLLVKKLKIKGKTITVPESLKKGMGVFDKSPQDKLIKKEKREARKKAREARRKAR